jgi:hypothetical protein
MWVLPLLALRVAWRLWTDQPLRIMTLAAFCLFISCKDQENQERPSPADTIAAVRTPARSAAPAALMGDTLFQVLAEVTLEEKNNPIAFVADVDLVGGRIAVTDAQQANVKFYNRNGGLDHILGRAGRGPGEFQRPWATLIHNDTVIVFEIAARQASVFTSDTTFVDSWRVSIPLVSGAANIPGGDLLLFGAAQGPAGSNLGLARISLDGSTKRIFGALPPITLPGERNVRTAQGAVVGSFFILGVNTRDEVQLLAADGSVRRHGRLGGDWYRPWTAPSRPPASRMEFAAWADQQIWLKRLITLSTTDFLAVFSTVDPNSRTELFRYVVSDTSLRIKHHSDWTKYNVQTIVRDTAYSVTIAADGVSVLRILRIRW